MKKYILLFDFGHGTRKYTKGKHSPDYKLVNGEKVYSLYEGEWVREVGRRIVEQMKELGVDCRIIVPEDKDISLTERCNRANKIVRDNPDAQCLFISVHINAASDDGQWHDASGVTVWVSKSNASNTSKELARTLYDSAVDFGLKGNRSVPRERYWQANFTVVHNTNCPAVLTENLFMDNRKELQFLLSEEGKETIVNYHVAGLCKFMGIPCGVVIDN